jgi:hypothetical protein
MGPCPESEREAGIACVLVWAGVWAKRRRAGIGYFEVLELVGESRL